MVWLRSSRVPWSLPLTFLLSASPVFSPLEARGSFGWCGWGSVHFSFTKMWLPDSYLVEMRPEAAQYTSCGCMSGVAAPISWFGLFWPGSHFFLWPNPWIWHVRLFLPLHRWRGLVVVEAGCPPLRASQYLNKGINVPNLKLLSCKVKNFNASFEFKSQTNTDRLPNQ